MIDLGGLKISDLFKIVALGSPHVEFLFIFFNWKSVARAVGLDPKEALGNEAQNLRLFLFESLDKTYTQEIQKAIEGCVTIGAQENFTKNIFEIFPIFENGWLLSYFL